jgi:hypothetical protein
VVNGELANRGSDPPARLTLLPAGSPAGASRSSGETEDCPGGKPQESWSSREGRPTRVSVDALERRPPGLPQVWWAKRMREGTGKLVPRHEGNALERRQKAQESIGPELASARRGTDLRSEQRPGAAGHRELLVLRARVRDARNGKRAQAPRGVRLCGGEKLCRVNPMSGTGPRGRKVRREQTVRRVRNPEGGPNRVWNPGSVDLRADVAVGAENPMKVAGAAQDSGGTLPVCLGGPSKPMGASRIATPVAERDGGPSENRAAVETARREP